jgi:tetratricopeptide (TPR) repeat protein
LQDYSDILQLDPGNLIAIYKQALIHNQQGRYKEALAEYDAILSFEPSYFYALIGRARVLQSLRSSFQEQSAAWTRSFGFFLLIFQLPIRNKLLFAIFNKSSDTCHLHSCSQIPVIVLLFFLLTA